MTKLATLSRLEEARLADEDARAEVDRWAQTVASLQARGREIDSALADSEEQLRAIRTAALIGNSEPAGLARLSQRERDLRGEKTEVVALQEVAAGEWQRTHNAGLSVGARFAALEIQAARDIAIARANELEEQIGVAFGQLVELLESRYQLDGRGPLGFDWARIPQAVAARLHYRLPFGG